MVDGRPVRLDYRLIFVWSESKARQEATTRERHVAKIRAEFEAVQRNLGRYSLKTTEVIVRRLEGAKGKYGEGELFDYRLSQDQAGQFQLAWGLDAAALERWQQLEGVYVLKTNLPRSTHRLTKILRTYKEQAQVERRFHHLKGPLAVAPMFLKNPERIGGLLCILVWALMVMALMERQVRRELKGQALKGLYPENRPSPAPTGPALIEELRTPSERPNPAPAVLAGHLPRTVPAATTLPSARGLAATGGCTWRHRSASQRYAVPIVPGGRSVPATAVRCARPGNAPGSGSGDDRVVGREAKHVR
jgi:hypothetical protein